MGLVLMLVVLFALCICMACGIFVYVQKQAIARRIKKFEKIKSRVDLTTENAFEIPLEKENHPLYIFKDGEKQKFVMRKTDKGE